MRLPQSLCPVDLAAGLTLFTIAFSLAGPQQQYIHNNHLEWVKWAAADEAVASYKASLAASEAHAGGLRPTRMRAMGRPVTPPAEDKRDPMSTPARRVALPSVTPGRHATAADGMVPVPQPRKVRPLP